MYIDKHLELCSSETSPVSSLVEIATMKFFSSIATLGLFCTSALAFISSAGSQELLRARSVQKYGSSSFSRRSYDSGSQSTLTRRAFGRTTAAQVSDAHTSAANMHALAATEHEKAADSHYHAGNAQLLGNTITHDDVKNRDAHHAEQNAHKFQAQAHRNFAAKHLEEAAKADRGEFKHKEHKEQLDYAHRSQNQAEHAVKSAYASQSNAKISEAVTNARNESQRRV